MAARGSSKLLVLLSCAMMATTVCAESSAKSGRATSIDGERIVYETAGDGDLAVVFVHGWSCDRTYFQHQFEAFSRQYRVVALDLAGHGESTVRRANSTIALYGADVAAVVKKLDLEPAVLVGHSMGGDVVVAAARLLEGRVAGLIWVDDYKNLGPPRTDAQIEAFVAPFRVDFPGTTDKLVRSMFRPDADPQLVDRIAKDMASAPPKVGITSIESSFKYAREIPAALAELKLPVIAINADNGPTDQESLARHGVKAVVLQRSGHFLMMEDPQRFNILLTTALEDLQKRNTSKNQDPENPVK
jgi:pimeloyl-ACP methyl ester carboxylesterase